MREKLAELMHEIWSGWMKHLFSKCWYNFSQKGGKDGSVTIPAGEVERWLRQMRMPYDELSEEEKDSDRKEADKVLAVTRPVYGAVRSSGKWNMVLKALAALYELHSQPHETDTYMAVGELMDAYDKWLD